MSISISISISIIVSVIVQRAGKIRDGVIKEWMAITFIPCRLIEEETPKGFLVGNVTSEINSLISPSNNTYY